MIAIKWTILTVITALSPFLLAGVILFYYENGGSESISFGSYYKTIIEDCILLYAAIGIAASAYYDYVYCNNDTKALMDMSFKRNCSLIFLFIIICVLVLYTPVQVLPRPYNFLSNTFSWAAIIISTIYAFYIKKTILETENKLIEGRKNQIHQLNEILNCDESLTLREILKRTNQKN